MQNIVLLTLAALVFSFAGFAANAQGVDAGDKISHMLDATDQAGEVRTFDNLVGEKGVTLVFYRSADWCPYCQAQLIDLNERGAEFESAGYPLVGISYDSVADLAKFSQKREISFPLLSDPDSDIIKAFGILNEDKKPGEFGYGIPHPAVYVVGLDRSVKAKFIEDGYKDRPEPDMILTKIKEIGQF